MRLTRIRPARISVIAAVALLAPAASAAGSVTLGNNLTGFGKTSVTCPVAGGCAVIQQVAPGRTTRAPFDGVVVRWRVRARGDVQLFVARYLGNASSDTIVRNAGSTVRHAGAIGSVSEFPSRLPIAAGQYVGVAWHDGASLVIGDKEMSGFDSDAWTPIPAVGMAATPISTARDQPERVAYSADIEPDADHDGYGDETQDACPTNPATQAACPPPPPPPPPPPTPPPDTMAPVFTSHPSMRPRVFGAGRGGHLVFSISEPARLTIVVERRRGHGFRSLGHLVRRVAQGPAAIMIRRRVSDHRMRPGRYLAVLRAVDGAGNTSASLHVHFRVTTTRRADRS